MFEVLKYFFKNFINNNSHHNSKNINKSVDNRGAGGFSLFGNASGNYEEINIERSSGLGDLWAYNVFNRINASNFLKRKNIIDKRLKECFEHKLKNKTNKELLTDKLLEEILKQAIDDVKNGKWPLPPQKTILDYTI